MANEFIHVAPSSSNIYLKNEDTSFTFAGALKVGYDGGNHYKGAIRFTNLLIPKNSSINSADLHLFVGSRAGSADLKIKVYGIDEDNTGDGDPFSRTLTTAFNTHTSNPSQGDYFSIGVGSIIEEIVGRSGWSSGNAIYFIVYDNGTTTGSGDQYLFDALGGSGDSYLHYRISAEPNFKPTPVSVTAPSIPTASSYGIKISRPGNNVFTATEEQLYFSTKRKQVKVFAQAQVTAPSTSLITIAHNLGYTPLVSIWEKGGYDGPTGNWVRLPVENYFSFDVGVAFADDTNLYIQPAYSGEKFYYYIFLDEIVA